MSGVKRDNNWSKIQRKIDKLFFFSDVILILATITSLIYHLLKPKNVQKFNFNGFWKFKYFFFKKFQIFKNRYSKFITSIPSWMTKIRHHKHLKWKEEQRIFKIFLKLFHFSTPGEFHYMHFSLKYIDDIKIFPF